MRNFQNDTIRERACVCVYELYTETYYKYESIGIFISMRMANNHNFCSSASDAFIDIRTHWLYGKFIQRQPLFKLDLVVLFAH